MDTIDGVGGASVRIGQPVSRLIREHAIELRDERGSVRGQSFPSADAQRQEEQLRFLAIAFEPAGPRERDEPGEGEQKRSPRRV